MRVLHAIFPLALTGTVDRVEGDLAVVEWADGAFSDVPVAVLGAAVREGDRVVLRGGTARLRKGRARRPCFSLRPRAARGPFIPKN